MNDAIPPDDRIPHPRPPRDPGDAWVHGPDGSQFWGRFGAAGLLLYDHSKGIVLQHRAQWSHFGGTWGLPGGALHECENPIDGAIREAHEEAGINRNDLRLHSTSVYDRQYWSYTTVITHMTRPCEPTLTDPEGIAVQWVPLNEVNTLSLHPEFARSWPQLSNQLRLRLVLIIDSANVVGSRPNGWWKDRHGAAKQLAQRLNRLAHNGVEAKDFNLPGQRWWPEIIDVVEGQARGARPHIDTAPPSPLIMPVSVVDAPHEGDDSIVDTVSQMNASDAHAHIVVVTSDRELKERVRSLGAETTSPGWLYRTLDAIDN